MRSDFIGRADELNKILDILNSPTKKKASIISIGGPGGVGKSTLMEEVLESDDWRKGNTLFVRVDGFYEDRIEKIIEEGFVKSSKLEMSGGYGYFKETEKTLKCISEIDAEIEKKFRKELQKNKKLNEAEIDSIVNVAIALGKGVNKISGKTKDYLDFEYIENSLDKDIKNLWHKLNNEMPSDGFSKLIPDFNGNKNLRERVRQNRSMALAESLDIDLHTILFGAKDLSHKFKPTQSKDKRFDNLLIIIEDYENKQHIMDSFLMDYFLPRLKQAKFESLLFIVGRDIVTNISSDWSHKYKKNIQIECDLDRFSSDEAASYIATMGIEDKDIATRLIEDTEGYPFLLEIEIENLKSKKGNAHTNKMFYDRTTKWMSETQRNWFENLCYLEVINLDTIQAILPEERSEAIYIWFENEASIRDAKLDYYTVKRIIKSKVLKYLEVKSPSTHLERIEKARVVEGVL